MKKNEFNQLLNFLFDGVETLTGPPSRGAELQHKNELSPNLGATGLYLDCIYCISRVSHALSQS